MSIIIFSPSKHSSYASLVAELLHQNDIRVSGFVTRRLFSFKRLFKEIRFDSRRLIENIYRKLILRKASHGADISGFNKFAEENSIKIRALREISEEMKVPNIFCYDLNEAKVENFLKEIKPDIIIFCGGGILRENIISVAKLGVINCHMGILPKYRGMDCYLWAILKNDEDNIGLTTHLIDEGIDTGRIISRKRISIKSLTSIRQIEQELEYNMASLLCSSIDSLIKDRKIENLEKQKSEDGKQYFSLSVDLRNIAEEYLKRPK